MKYQENYSFINLSSLKIDEKASYYCELKKQDDLAEILDFATNDKLNNLKIDWKTENCITIVLCAKGYPLNYIKDSEIKNLQDVISDKNNQIFHAGTYEKNNKIFSSGGRVLNITSCAENLEKSRENCLNNINKINWKDGFFRKDIGYKIIKNNKI